MGSKYTESQARAIDKYTSKLAVVSLRLPPDEKEMIMSHCLSQGESLTSFARRAFQNQIELDNKEATQ